MWSLPRPLGAPNSERYCPWPVAPVPWGHLADWVQPSGERHGSIHYLVSEGPWFSLRLGSGWAPLRPCSRKVASLRASVLIVLLAIRRRLSCERHYRYVGRVLSDSCAARISKGGLRAPVSSPRGGLCLSSFLSSFGRASLACRRRWRVTSSLPASALWHFGRPLYAACLSRSSSPATANFVLRCSMGCPTPQLGARTSGPSDSQCWSVLAHFHYSFARPVAWCRPRFDSGPWAEFGHRFLQASGATLARAPE